MSYLAESIFYSLFFSLVFTQAAQPGENIVTIFIDGLEKNSTILNEQHAKQVTIVVAKQNLSYTIDLVLNTMLLSNSFTEKVFTKNGSYTIHSNQSRDFCYYMGSVRGKEEEHVAFTACPLLKGFFTVGSSRWFVTQSKDDRWNVSIEKTGNDHKFFCGVRDVKTHIDSILEKNPTIKRKRRSVVEGFFEDMLVVEMYLANDLSRYRQYGSTHGVFQSSKEIANVANTVYQPLGILIILVGVEVWTDRNRIDVSTNSSSTLKGWMAYRHSAVRTYNDVGFFLSTTKYQGSTLGLAHVGTICSQRESGGIVQSIEDKSDVSGGILAHEVGHNFGMIHDTQSCTCDNNSKDCIMSSRASTQIANKHFSDCSIDQMRNSLKKGLDICLHDIPTTLNEYLAVCGNGIIEEGEECDCGRLPSHLCNKACCNMENCKLKGQCAQGGCCDVASCSLKKSGNTCREEKAGLCDLPETCDGKSPFCPQDSFVQEGTECTIYNIKGSCFEGECRNRESQCKILYGESARDGNDLCYNFNRKGDLHGYCAYNLVHDSNGKHTFYPCSDIDYFCGTLQCNPPKDDLIKYQKFLQKSKKTIGSNRCFSVLLDFGKRVKDPGLVPDGAPCGEDRVCKNARCVDRKALLKINACDKCVNGRCSNKGFCHCDYGFMGPSCEEIKPSETPNDTALIVVLTILFIVLVIIIFLVIYDSLNKQHILNFFKNIANKYNRNAFNKNVNTPHKTTISNEQYKGNENPVYSIDIPQTSAPRHIPKHEISNPMNFYNPFNTSNKQIKEGFDNPGLKDDETKTRQQNVTRPIRPPIPKPYVPQPLHETNTNKLKKPSREPPSLPASTNIKHNSSSKPPSTKTTPPRPPPPTKHSGIVAQRINRLENHKADFTEV